jgi:hypothetical protein
MERHLHSLEAGVRRTQEEIDKRTEGRQLKLSDDES